MSRAVARTLVIAFFTAIVAVWNGGDILLPWYPFASYGFSATPGGVITATDHDVTARGLHVGDRVEVARLTPAERAVFGYFPLAPPGNAMRLPLAGGRRITVVSHSRPRSLADNVTDVMSVLALWAFIGIAAALVLLRPSPVTWAFFTFAFSVTFAGTLVPEYVPTYFRAAGTALAVMSQLAGAAALLSFALRFPDKALHGAMLRLERFVLFVLAPVLVVAGGGLSVAYVAGAIFYAPIGQMLFAVEALLLALAVGVLLARYAASREADRNRLRWVVAAFSVAFLPTIGSAFFKSVLSHVPDPWVENLVLTWELLAPIALAYTILRHRLFDIRFVISRALVYAVLTSVTVGLLALADWAFGAWLAQSRLALVAEVGLALALGVTMTSVHKRIEGLLNSVIFRAQAVALQALRRFAQETDLIPDSRHLLAQTYEALCSRLECEYVAIYTGEGAAYTLASPGQTATPVLLTGYDLAVLRLRRWHEPFECDEPGHPLRGALLLPMAARGQLVGFIACGPKIDRTRYLQEEIATLSLVAQRTGSAYALLTLTTALPVTTEGQASPAS
jgi:hypothetical protein